MKALVERAALLAPAKRLAQVARAKTTIPILGCVRIEAGGDGLRLTATDVDSELVETVTAATEAIGVVCIEAAALARWVAALPDGAQIMMATRRDGRLELTAGASRATFGVLDAADFPVMKTVAAVATFALTAAEIEATIGRVAPFVSTEETRYYLNGVLLAIGDGRLDVVATDGHRLGHASLRLPDGAEAAAALDSVILPRATLPALLAVADGATVVEVAISGSLAAVSSGARRFTTRLIDATYPQWQRIAPAPADGLVVGRIALLGAISRARIVAGHATVGCESGVLAVTASSETGGEARETIDDVDGALAHGGAFGIDLDYLRAMLDAIASDRVRFGQTAPDAPIRIEAADGDDGVATFVGVVMPYRVG